MQLTIPRSELKQAVAGLSRVVPKRATLPVLQTVRFTHEGGRTTVSGTDLDQSLAYRFATANVDGGGTFLVGLADLQLLTKGPDADSVTFNASEPTSVEITHPIGGQLVGRLITTEDPKEWPTLGPKVDAGPVDSAFLANFRRVATATSNDESRRVLMGVYLDSGKKGDYLIGCDGRRLCAVNTIKLPFKENCIVPASKFMTWTKLESEELLIGFSQPRDAGWFRLVTPQYDYQVRTIEGTYPNWRQVVPSEDGHHRFTMSEEDAALLLKILPTFAGHDTHNAGITLVTEKGKLLVLGHGKDDKSPTRLDLLTSKSEGADGRTTVAREYLTDALATGFRAFAFEDECSPLKASDGKGGVHVLMPLRSAPTEVPKASTPAEAPAQPPAPVTVPTSESTTNHNQEEKPMKKTPESTNEQPQGSALERVLAAYETAKAKVKEANEALAVIAVSVKEALKEDKQRRQEVESVRAGLARLQSIKV
jgi:DNA polymerase-3 subunit beta